MCKHSIVASYSSSSKCKSGFYKHDDLTDQAHDKSEIFYIDLGHVDEQAAQALEELLLVVVKIQLPTLVYGLRDF